MARSSKILFAAFAAGLMALPTVATAQEPTVPEARDEVQTGTRIQPIIVIGAIRDARAPKRAEQPTDTSLPELPVTYEDAPGS